MSRHRSKAEQSSLNERLSALNEARELAEGRLPDAALAEVGDVLDRAASRRSLSANHTVVGFFGATGSGKSSLFNAVTGTGAATVAARRPTTAEPLAAVWGSEGSEPLLDWLNVSQRHWMDDDGGPGERGEPGTAGERRAKPAVVQRAPKPARNRRAKPGATGGRPRRPDTNAPGHLILLDLPDFDSTAAEHRQIVEKMAGQVDVLVWVMDPQKYADAAVHYGFLRPLASHGAVTLVVLNQVDRLHGEEVDQVVGSLRGLLAQDGLTGAEVHLVSAVTGTGIDGLRETIQQVTARREAAAQRLAADVERAAGTLSAASADSTAGSTTDSTGPEHPAAGNGTTGTAEAGKRERQQLVDGLAKAARVESVVDAVAGSYRRRARARTGWPVTRWLGRFRPDPLRRLNLGRDDVVPEVNRSSLPEQGAAQRAQADSAVRDYADAVGSGAAEPWRASIRRAAAESREHLPDALDQAVAGTDLRAGKGSWWWPLVGLLQWLGLAAAVVGAGWLGCLAVMGYLQLTVAEPPAVEGFPLPTLLLLGGIVLGILLALIAAVLARLTARRRAKQARRRLLAAVRKVAEVHVMGPVQAEAEALRSFNDALARATAS
ncbi:GTPase family protein [Arthrobacter castelli]|uniref:GTPase family protein n=1 Tax=Arthrobacter castelli TaxID=271431 RepID=UPI000417CCCA|nr:dynamin family protein [Arthrobacter castelli]